MKEQEKNEMREFLYNDCDGVFTRIRNNDFDFSEEELNKILDLANRLHQDMESNNVDRDKVLIVIELLWSLGARDQDKAIKLFEDIVVSSIKDFEL